jgi:hypothetical protein
VHHNHRISDRDNQVYRLGGPGLSG